MPQRVKSPLEPAHPYPIRCPLCHQVGGKPIAVSTIAITFGVRIELACGACRHRWAEEVSRADAT